MPDPTIFYGSNNRTLNGFYVQSANSSVSWGDTGSSLNLTLVREGDNFDYTYNDFPATVSHPMRFRCGTFYFGGILTKVVKKKATSGLTYEAVITDPREILQATQVIIGQYPGTVPMGVGNIVNVYGYLESFGFGYSGRDDIGMPWTTFFSALLSIINQPLQTPYGGPMCWGVSSFEFPNGIFYSLDLSQLPIPDPYYRIEGNYVVSLFDIISKICQDAGYDFVVELVGYSIKIRTISRKFAPALGTIGAIVNTPGTNAVSNEYGIEMAQGNQTAAMIVGGPREGVFSKTNYRSFWGYDAGKNMILGHPGVMVLRSRTGGGVINYPVEMMNLYAQGVEDVIGGSYYFCSTLELQFALAGIDSWMEFVEQYRPDVFFAMSGFASNRTGQTYLNGFHVGDQVQTNPIALLARSLEATYDRSELRRRFFQWLSGVAQQYMGKEFVVSLGISQAAINPTSPFTNLGTLNLRYEFDIVRSAFAEIDSAPLGLTPLAASQFTDEQNKFEPFALYTFQRLTTNNAKIEDPQNTIFDTLGVYGKASVGDRIETMRYPSIVSAYTTSPFAGYIVYEPILYAGGPLVRVTVQTPIFSRAFDPFGDHSVVSTVLGTPSNLYQINAESSKTRMSPPPVYPSAFAIPLKSNRYTYGPFWTYSSIPGRVRVEVDPELVPWNYGSESVMNQVALARLFDGSSRLALTENGSITLPGFPSTSLGQTLQANGPAVTSIQINFGTSGITSTYSFQNYSPRFGVVPRQMIDRLRKTGQVSLQLRRNLYKLQVDAARVQQSVARSSIGGASLAMAAGAFDKFHRVQTPHDCMAGFASLEAGSVRLDVKTAPLHELMANTAAFNGDAYANRAVVSQDALFRPYRSPVYNTNYSSTQNGIQYRTLPDNTLLPKVEMPMVAIPGVMTSYELNTVAYPFWTDVAVVTYQQLDGTPCEINTYKGAGFGAFEGRSMGLRGPVTVIGYGTDLFNGGIAPQGILTGNGHESNKLKAGPVDLMWDDLRKVWSGNGTAKVKILADTSGGLPTSGYVYLGAQLTSKAILIYPTSTGQIIRADDALAQFMPLDGKWYIGSVSAEPANVKLGVSPGKISPGATGSVSLTNSGGSITAYNYVNVPVESGYKVIVAPLPGSELYVVLATDQPATVRQSFVTDLVCSSGLLKVTKKTYDLVYAKEYVAPTP